MDFIRSQTAGPEHPHPILLETEAPERGRLPKVTQCACRRTSRHTRRPQASALKESRDAGRLGAGQWVAPSPRAERFRTFQSSVASLVKTLVALPLGGVASRVSRDSTGPLSEKAGLRA